MKTRLALLSLATALSLMVALPAFGSPAATKDEKRLELLAAHAGEPVDRVRFIRAVHAYEVVGPLNVLIWETPSKAWLVDLRQSAACRHLDRDFAIGIDTVTDSINTRNSYIVARGGVNCRVDRIREVNVQDWKQAERDAGIRQ